MRCFIQDLSIILFRSFLHGSSSSSWEPLAVWAVLTQAIGSKISNFHLMHLSIEPMNLDGTKWLFDSRTDIVIKYKLDNVSCITYWSFGHIGWKYMDNKFQLLSDVYFGARYLRFICLENVIVLFDSLSGNFFKKN